MRADHRTTAANYACSSLLAAAAILLVGAAPAAAHPHVWVDVRAEIVYEDGRITGIRNAWIFDEGYSEMAVEGLDANGDGTYDRNELAELAQVNIDGMTEFGFFTHVKLGAAEIAIERPRDYWLQRDDKGILSLHFFTPLAQPVLAGAPGFTLQIFDPSYYIAFNFMKERPVALSGKPPNGCKVDLSVPADEAEDAKRLGDAFLQQFGGDIGIGLAETVSVSCPAA